MLDAVTLTVAGVLSRYDCSGVSVIELARLCVAAADKTAIEHRIKIGACPTCGFAVSLPDSSQTYSIRKGN